MPTYEYVCTECGGDLEAVQKFSDDPLTECPRCGGRLRKRFSPVGVVFKGSGFYKTDSRSGGSSGGGAAKPKAETSTGSGSSETTSAPAAKEPSSTSTAGTSSTTTSGSSSTSTSAA